MQIGELLYFISICKNFSKKWLNTLLKKDCIINIGVKHLFHFKITLPDAADVVELLKEKDWVG